MALRVLTWNLFHGRSKPETPHSLLPEFAALLASWEWDVALLQEVLPWWPVELGVACEASARMALTSRNVLPPVQRLLAEPRPDVFKSWSGGCNAILLRGPPIPAHPSGGPRPPPPRPGAPRAPGRGGGPGPEPPPPGA